MDLCRACLSSDKDLLQPDQSFMLDYNLLTNLNVNIFDGKSQKFCQTCLEAVNFFIQFRNQCVSSETSLQEICPQHASKKIKSEKLEDKTDTDVKEEIKVEVDDPSFEDPVLEYGDEDSNYIKTENIDIKVKKSRTQAKKRKSAYTKVKSHKSISEVTRKKNAKPTCGLCGKIFNDAALLKDHLDSHKSDRKCKLCDLNTFEHWPQLLAHALVHARSQRCHLCDKNFRSVPQLQLHYMKIHCGEKNVLLACSQCPSKFSTPRRLSKHVWANHSAKRYVCDFCSKVFNNKQLLKSHIVGHGTLKRFFCDLCDYSSKYAGGLSAHKVRKHVPSKCVCKTCQRLFADAEKLAQHTCVDRSRVCPVCGKEMRRGGFARHMLVHREDKTFRCARCPAAYRTRAALSVHADRHDGTPRHQCDTCRRRFYSRPVLVKHRRVHTGEKPYACSKCEMRFTGGNNLKVHMKVHGEMLVVKRTPGDSV